METQHFSSGFLRRIMKQPSRFLKWCDVHSINRRPGKRANRECYSGSAQCQFRKKVQDWKGQTFPVVASNPHPFSNSFFPHSYRQEYQKNLSLWSCSWQFCCNHQNMLAVGNGSSICRTGCHLCQNQTEIEIATSILLSGYQESAASCSKPADSTSGASCLYHLGLLSTVCVWEIVRYLRKSQEENGH